MTWWIVTFVLAGAGFGLATFPHRHWFSEGPSRPAGSAPRDALDGRPMWVLMCSGLWPIFALTGLYSLYVVKRRASRS